MRRQIRIVAVGHVDHGKSTLIGRLLHDTGNLPDGKVAEMQIVSERRGVPFEWSFLLDAMQSERDQAITIDTTRIWLRTPDRDVVLIDAPGHKEFLRNMVTGASDADAAMLLVDAHDGVSEQTRRHALLLELIGVRRVVVVINKMDLVDYDPTRYDLIREELEALLGRIGIAATQYVPISARSGENVTEKAPAMAWYDGPTVLDAILALPVRDVATGTAFRMAVQGTIRRDLQRIVVGRVESGSIAVGDAIAIAPSMRVAHVASIDVWPPDGRTVARAGESVGITLDGPCFVDRGDVIAKAEDAPTPATAFRARLLWLGTRALEVGDGFRIRIGTRTSAVRVRAFERVVDIDALAPGDAQRAQTSDVAEVVFESREALALDTVATLPGLARFILLDGIAIVAGGTILDALDDASNNVVPVGHLLDRSVREKRNGHRGAVLWLTGLPGAGKSTIAMELERRLFERGAHTYVLDGDNLRVGLNADLGFSEDDRRENIRRVAEVAALFADAGTIAIAAFISPKRVDRERAREIVGNAFVEVYVKADTATCEARDPKGHYARARAGSIADFTGIDDSYQAPGDPDITIDTEKLSRDEAVDLLLAYVTERIVASAYDRGSRILDLVEARDGT